MGRSVPSFSQEEINALFAQALLSGYDSLSSYQQDMLALIANESYILNRKGENDG